MNREAHSLCDVLDVLEESALFHTPVVVRLQDGQIFEDRVETIAKWKGEDHVAFARHDQVPVRAIEVCQRAAPIV